MTAEVEPAPRRQSNPILADFFEGTRTPKQAQIDFLTKRHGVPNLALAFDGDRVGFVVGAADVTFQRRRFDFAPDDEEGVPALVFVARDDGGEPRDLVAWSPREGTIASYKGRVTLLGEHDLCAPRLEALAVHRSPLGWLRASRNGVVIIDERRAWQVLYDIKVAAEDIGHGLELRSILTPPAPSIVVPRTTKLAA